MNSWLCLKTKKYDRSEESDNTTNESLEGSMSHRLIERLSIIGSEAVEDSRVESCLVSHIHSVVYDDDRDHETDGELVTPWSILEPHSGRECDDKCRVSRWHPATSEHPSKWESPLESMNYSLHYDSDYQWDEWYDDRVCLEKCMNSWEHIRQLWG